MRQRILLLLLLLAGWGARAQTLLQSQSFENGETVNYTASTVASGNADIYFVKASVPVAGFTNNATPTNVRNAAGASGGTFFWASENVRRDPSNASPVRANPPANLTMNSVSVAGKSNLNVTVALADPNASSYTVANWETNDIVRIQYAFDGSTTWSTAAQFVGGTVTGTSSNPNYVGLRQDTNLDGTADAGAPTISSALTDFNFAIPGSGSMLQVRVQIDQDGVTEEFAFDAIRVYGSAAASAAPALANIENTALAYAEGSGAAQITSGITVSDTDSPNLSSATITISANYQSSEDRLLFTNQNGITTTGFNTSTGTLTLTGTASLLDYQNALRAVQYQNIDANDASPLTRTVSFSVTDATSVGSNTVKRDIAVTAALDNAYVGLPYVEPFEDPDGEGTRYASNHFRTQDAAQFQRTTQNPIPNGTTFTNIQGSYYWVAVNTNATVALNPTGTFNGTVTTKQINAAGYTNLVFQLRVGASTSVTNNPSNWKTTDYFQLRYRVAGSSTWVPFGLFRGTNPTSATGTYYMRQDSNPNGTGAPTGTQLTEALQNFTFNLPTSLNGQTVDFQMLAVVQDGVNFLAFDNLQVTGTQVVAPSVTTTATTGVTTATAVANGNVTSDGGEANPARGVVYSSTNSAPVLSGTNTTTVTSGTGTGTFSANLAGLTPGTRYYVQAYATNSINTSYGGVLQFVTTPNAPTVNAPANGALVATTTPTYSGGAQAGATVTVYVDGVALSGTVTADGSGNWSKAQPSALSQGSHTVYATAVVTVGGTSSAASTSLTNNFTVDTVAPAAPVITAPAANGFVATTTPTISGTAEANSTVVVKEGSTTLGTTTATSAGAWSLTSSTLAQGSHTISVTATDAAGNVSPAATRTFTVDTAAPGVSITSTAGNNGTTTNTTPIPFTVMFTESVTGFSQSKLNVSGGAITGFTGTSPGTTYTFNVTPSGTNTLVTVNIAANAATDAAGNGNTAATQYSLTYQPAVVATSKTVTVNLAANGTGTLQASDVNNGSTGAGTPTYTIQKIVYGRVAENSTLTLTTPNGANFTGIRFASYGTPTNDTNGNYRKGTCDAANSVTTAQNSFSTTRSTGSMDAVNAGGVNNTPQLGDPCSGTPKALAVQAAYSNDATSLSYDCSEVGKTQYVLLTVTDANGNTNTATALVTVNAPPTISITSISPSSAQRGTSVTVTGTNLGGIGSTVTVNGASASVSGLTNTSGNAYTFNFVVPNTATIGAGNLTVTAPCSQTVSPTFTVQNNQTATPALTTPANGSTTNGTPTFTGTSAPNAVITFYLNNQNVGTITADGSGNFGAQFGSTLPSGTYTLYVTAQAGAQPVSNPSATITFTVDSTQPVPIVSTTSASPTSTAPIPFRVTFNEAVTGFNSGGVTVTNGSVNTFSGSGTTYNLTITPNGTGTVTVSVPQNVAQDGVGNQNVASNSVSVQYNQPTTATPVLTAPANGSFVRTNQPEYRGTAVPNSFIFIYRGGALTDTTIANGLGNFHKFSGAALADGTYSVYVTATTQGSATSANSNTNTFTVDTTPPTVTLTSSTVTNGGATSTSPVLFTATFSEQVVNFTSSGIFVSRGTVTSGPTAGSGNTYTFQVTPSSAGTVVVQVLPGAAKDLAGNNNTSSTSYSFTYSLPVTAAPVVTTPADGSLLNTTTPTYSGTAPANSTVTVYVDGTALSGTVTADGSGNWSKAQPTALSQGSHTVYARAQSSGSSLSANSNTNNFTVDTVAPTVTITSTAGASGSTTATTPIPFTATFSESVTGFAANKVTVTNGTVTTSSFTAVSGTTYTFTVTPTVAGSPTTVNVVANQAQDAAGNGNTAAASAYTLTYSAPVTSVTWNGNISTNWFTAGNWTPNTVPDATIDAVIPTAPSGGLFPVIGANGGVQATAKSVSIASNASLSMSANMLTIAANLTNNGNFNGFTGSGASATGGTVSLGNSALSQLNGGGVNSFWNLSVGANGAQLNNTNATSVSRLLTLSGNLATSSNPFTLVSDATATAMVVNSGGVVTGNVTVQRYIDPTLNPNLGYRHISPAISNATVSSLTISGSFSPVVNPAYNSSATPLTTRPFPTVYGYDQSRLATTTNNLAAFDKGWFSPSATSDPLPVGLGRTVLIAANQTWNFTGSLNNGDQTLNLGRNSGATAANSGLHLVGNPYPAPLDWSQVAAADRPNVDNVIYVWRSTNPGNPYGGAYGSYNNGTFTGSLTSTVLAQGQGFFVRVTQGTTAGSLTFRNAQRVSTYQTPTYGRPAETRPFVRLALQGVGSADVDDAVVYFEQGATAGNDGEYDAEKLSNPSGLNVSTSVSADLRMAINGLSPLGTTQLVVPVAVGVPAVGSYTLKAAELLNLGSTPTYLRDLQTGAVIDLAAQPSYQFTVSNASALLTGRFELVFSPQQPLATATAALAQQVALYPNPATGSAFVELPAQLGRQAVTATLVDAVGREVRTVTLPAQGAVAHSLDLRELPSGVYMLRLATSAGTLVKKLTVE